MTNHRLALALGAALVTLACAVAFLAGANFSRATLHTETVELPDGTQVTCISSDSGGVSCSWTRNGIAPFDPEIVE